jgi:ribose transport system ATP-binding protein
MLSVRGLTKTFGGTQVLRDVDFEASRGQVVAILGENGAGKSTLMRLLAGAIRPDTGEMVLDERPFSPKSPADGRENGVALVPQEPELAMHLSVAENVMLGCEPTRMGFVDRGTLRANAEVALKQVTGGAEALDCRRAAFELSPSERQQVTIARALAQPNLRVLIFDEPTSSLTATDIEHLFAVVTRLKAEGIIILYVSHFLEEVLRIADRYYVLRDGQQVASGSIAETTASALVEKMAGAVVGEAVQRVSRKRGKLRLEVRGLSGVDLPVDVAFELYAGEILGIAGLIGAGRSEMVRVLFGLEPLRAGTINLNSVSVRPTPASSLDRGLGLLSEDRRSEGLAHTLGIARNITLSKWTGWGPFTMEVYEASRALPLVERLAIRCRGLEQPVSELSGGNQQKVALGRLLYQDADILLLDEPTRGIDVRSRLEVHRLIDELACRGKAILLISSYLPELLSVCDRIAVMCRGRLGTARPASEWNEHSLLMRATGLE